MYTVRKTESARPLTARSIIASTLLGTHPPRLPVARLVRSCALFGVSENAARVALSRMTAAGEVTYHEGRYELVGRLRDRQARQDASRRGQTGDAEWAGTWLLAVIAGDGRPATERSELRSTLRQRRYGEWREGVWVRPDNLGAADADRRALVPCSVVHGAQLHEGKQIALEVFALQAWASAATDLRRTLASQQVRLRRGDETVLPDAFIANAAALRQFQADPFLPPQLLPRSWPGSALRDDFETFDAAFQTVWRAALAD